MKSECSELTKLLSNPVSELKIRENDSHCRSIVLKTIDRSIVKQLEKEKNNNFNVENLVVMFRCLDNGMYIYFCKLIVKSHIYYIIPHVHRIHIRIGGVMISVLASSAGWGWVRAVPSYSMGTLGMCPGPHEHRDPCYFVYVVYIMLFLMFKH